MTKNESELDQAYLAGLDASLWWGKFSEFLYATNEGATIRRELQKDYLAWQQEELGRDPAKGLLTWQALFKKLFPDVREGEEEHGRKKSGGKKKTQKKAAEVKKKEVKVSPNGVKKPRKIENKPRKIELKNTKKVTTEKTKGSTAAVKNNAKVGAKNGVGGVNGTKTKKEIKFKNIK